MAIQSPQSFSQRAWVLARRQRGVVTRSQLLALGLTPQAIAHRRRTGRLHPTPWCGVYLVGRPELSRHGRWMAAVLACGPEAALSHDDAAALLGIRRPHAGKVHVTAACDRRRPGIVVHRRTLEPIDLTRVDGIPLTSPVCTVMDLATRLDDRRLEAAINKADKLGLVQLESLRARVDECPGRPGAPRLRRMLDRATFVLTESELERRFLPIARRAGLPRPDTQRHVSGYRVDFYWHELGLVVETDGGSYHRTPFQQTTDRRRDQAHLVAGLTPLRFTHAQVAFEPGHVEATLAAVARRLAARR